MQGCVYEMSRDAYEALWRRDPCGNRVDGVVDAISALRVMIWTGGHRVTHR